MQGSEDNLPTIEEENTDAAATRKRKEFPKTYDAPPEVPDFPKAGADDLEAFSDEMQAFLNAEDYPDTFEALDSGLV